MERLTHLDLFSGIGGFALAAQWAGFETIGFSEIDPFCCRVLAKHWPGVRNYGDIKDIREPIGCDLITGGFPCQPFSVAGKRGGKSDDRYLWPEMLNVIAESRPAWVVGENVAGIIAMELDNVLSDLEAIGYACRPFVIPACAVDARHRRDRLWVVGRDVGDSKRPEWRENHDGGRCDRKGQNIEGQETSRTGESSASVAYTERQSAGRGNYRTKRGQRGESETTGNGWPGRTVSDVRWLPEPDVGRVAHGIPNRVDRLRGLGNAIVPQVAYEILKAIAQIENMKTPPVPQASQASTQPELPRKKI